jgi:hypothetical protein
MPTPPPIAAQPVSGDQCLAALDAAGVRYRQVPPPEAPHPCGIDTPVLISADPLPYRRPMLMGCALADRVAQWESKSVTVEAERYLGQRVIAALPMVGYSCRREIGSNRNYVSQHGYGRALDIGGWRLGDGSVVTVEKDWHDRGAKGQFLHAVALDGCRYFSVVLTPDVNRAHRTHFHVDIGDYRDCAPAKHT